MKNEIYQIDLCPVEENGKWVVREEVCIDSDKWEEVEEYRFDTKELADAFIDRWIEKNWGI